MSIFLIDSLNQKFELRGFKVFFHLNDSVAAETVLNSLDKASPVMSGVFGLATDPSVEVYVYPDGDSFEKAGQKPLAMGEFVRPLFDENVLLLCSQQLPQHLGEESGKGLAQLVFNNEVKEREVAPKQFRTPSWLRDGYISLASLKLRQDWNAQLLNGWSQLQEAEKQDKLIKPGIMTKSIGLIPDPARRALGYFQAFFMVKFLHSVYPEKFFKRYATLMGVIDDMEAEAAFMQITGYDFEKFFGMFKEWVRGTNIWAAVSD
jgi:hypothetical protein